MFGGQYPPKDKTMDDASHEKYLLKDNKQHIDEDPDSFSSDLDYQSETFTQILDSQD
jgi:hypothetical protein